MPFLCERVFWALTLLAFAGALLARDSVAVPVPIAGALERAGIPQSAVTLLIEPLDGGPPLVRLNPQVARNPASLIKLITTYAALELLGPGYRWSTEIYLRGPLKNGVLKGHLAVRGGGDPFMRMQDFWLHLRELRRRGVRKITGNLLLDDGFFAPIAEDAGDFDGRPARTYNLAPNALLVNLQAVRLSLKPAGDSVAVDMVPDLPGVRLRNRLRLIPGECVADNADISVAVTGRARNRLELRGDYPIGCVDYQMVRTVLQPHSYFYALFRLLWEEQGGVLGGWHRKAVLNVSADEEPFMVWQSAPLREILVSTNKHSNNTMARHLLLTIAAETRGVPARPEQGVAAIVELLQAQEVPVDNLVLVNGSGRARLARADGQMLIEVIRRAYRSPLAAEFFASLPLNGVDGTMRRRQPDAEAHGYAHFKTGRLKAVTTLAGVVQAQSGRRYALVFMVNHPAVHRGIGNEIGDLIVDWVHRQ